MVLDLLHRLQSAYADSDLVVVEGFHALKHAVRFGAEILEVAVRDRSRLLELCRTHAPDLDPAVLPIVDLPAGLFARIAPVVPATGVVAIARRPATDARRVLAADGPAPLVLLENTRRLENIGAVVRVAAAAGAAGVLCVGAQDPWHPAAIRGAAGLQFALPVARLDRIAGPLASGRPLIAFDADGECLGTGGLPPRAMLAFGTERDGLSAALRAMADRQVRIPMADGVSSLNIATAVAVALYAWRGITA